MSRFTLSAAMVSIALLLPTTIHANKAFAGGKDVLLIFDSSASMSEQTTDGKIKIDVAKRTLTGMIDELPSQYNVGLMAYGHRYSSQHPSSCQDIQVVVPVLGNNTSLLRQKVQEFTPRGNTPIASSLFQAGDVLRNLDRDRQKVIVLVTDGIETCSGDPSLAAAQLKGMGIDLDFYVVGFDLSAKKVRIIKAIAQAGGGEFYNARNADELVKVIKKVTEIVAAPPQPKPKPEPKPEPKIEPIPEPSVYFRDDFDGEELAEHWEIINPDSDAYIVENGQLLVVNGTKATLADTKVPNLFQLKTPLPQGDWEMTMQADIDVQTGYESIVFGLYQDKDNFIVADANYGTFYYGKQLEWYLHGHKRAKGKLTSFKRTMWNGSSESFAKVAKIAPHPYLLRLTKRGRSYTVSVRAETGKLNKWTEMQKFTSLRARGNLTFALLQTGSGSGETTMTVDWVKIEQLD